MEELIKEKYLKISTEIEETYQKKLDRRALTLEEWEKYSAYFWNRRKVNRIRAKILGRKR